MALNVGAAEDGTGLAGLIKTALDAVSTAATQDPPPDLNVVFADELASAIISFLNDAVSAGDLDA
jgi:hypothetical protein